MSKFYITTPIYYVNAKPHLGGAYTTLAADVLARWSRMKGKKTFFLTGTDEHGEKIAQTARENNLNPKEFCDQNAGKYETVWDTLQISYDKFVRTTDSDHEKLVSRILDKLKEKGLIYQGEYQGLYCIDCERYYTVKELDKGKCPMHQKQTVSISEKCYFFKLSSFQDTLIDLIKKDQWLIGPIERKNEVLGFLTTEKLEDLAISREKVEWGIPLSWDKNQTIYVWIDALINYFSGIGWDGESKLPDFWPPDIQLIGKDILRFHAVIWPAILLSLDVPLPKKLFAHGFFTIGGQKMSKSLGNILDPEELAIVFGSDALRWLILSAYPFGQDGDISESKFYDKYQTDLSHGLGNLLSRILSLVSKDTQNKEYFFEENNDGFQEKIKEIWEKYEKALEELRFETAILNINELVRFCDKYIDLKKPWEIIKSNNKGESRKLLFNLLESERHLAWLTQSFMPEKSDQIFKSLGLLGKEKKKTLKRGQEWGNIKFKNISENEQLFPQL